ncbi:ankyrin repeat domain-containing protein [bacterium]|nr:ankyrin repeat domain-containing protein [bacterium]
MLELLLERGADLTRLNEDGSHSLHFCALGGDLERLKILLDHGADPRQMESGGAKALGYAMSPCSNSQVVEELLAWGA